MVDQDLLRRAVMGRCEDCELVLTGRDPAEWMFKATDYCTEMRCLCHPYAKGIPARGDRILTTKHVLPADIERTSMQMIDDELSKRGIVLSTENGCCKACHTYYGGFDYAETARFTPGAVSGGLSALSAGTAIVTDTNMALAGISKPAMRKLGGAAYCFMADRDVAEFAAKTRDHTSAGIDVSCRQSLSKCGLCCGGMHLQLCWNSVRRCRLDYGQH